MGKDLGGIRRECHLFSVLSRNSDHIPFQKILIIFFDLLKILGIVYQIKAQIINIRLRNDLRLRCAVSIIGRGCRMKAQTRLYSLKMRQDRCLHIPHTGWMH